MVVGSALGDMTDDEICNFLDKVCNVLNGKIATSAENLGKYVNSTNNCISMKREVIASTSIHTGKKRYAMSVLDNEGVRYSEPDIKIMGLEIVRSTSSKYISEKLKKGLVMLLEDKSESEVKEFIRDTKNDFMNNENIDELAMNTGIGYLDGYENEAAKKVESLFEEESEYDTSADYKNRTPIYYRAAMLYNKHFGKEKIQNGDSVKYIYLTLPNPIKENVIGWNDKFPEKMRSYIDKSLTYEKTFLIPMEKLTKLSGWDVRNEKISLFG